MKNTTIKNAYLVISCSEIRAMLHAAELEKKVRGEDRESITITLVDITVYPGGPCQPPQIASWSIIQAVDRLVDESNNALELRC